MSLQPLTSVDAGDAARGKINAAIAEASKVSSKQDGFDLPGLLATVSTLTARIRSIGQEADQTQADLAAAVTAAAGLAAQVGTDEATAAALALTVQGLASLLARTRIDLLSPWTRPGDASAAFTLVSTRASLAGDGRSPGDMPVGTVASGDSGLAARVTGATILSQRQATPIEPGRIYQARFVVQRRANPSDPANDAVVLGLAWLDAGFNVVPASNDVTLIETMPSLVAGYGRQERVALFSRSPSPDAAFLAPARARYARAFVQTYGADGVTDIEVAGIEDVSLATILAPATADTIARVSALESVHPGARLTALEAAANTPNSMTFPSKSDAASGTIPATVTTVALRGATQAGDGGDALYVRITGSAPAGSDSFINGGASFVRVFPSAAALGAVLRSLPTSLPATPNVAWLDGNVLVVS